MGVRDTTVRARELGLALRRAMRAANLGNRDVARILEFSDSKVNGLLSGARAVNTEDVAALLAICRVSSAVRERLLGLARQTHERGWWQDFGDRLPPEVHTLIEHEDTAVTVTDYTNTTLPAMLQTERYMRALMGRSATIPANRMDEWVRARLRRQTLFDRATVPSFLFLVEEAALLRAGPGRDVMSDQLHHLLRLSVRPQVRIRVVPDAVGFHAGRHPLRYMEFSEINPVVCVDTETGVLFIEQPESVAAYRNVLLDVTRLALGVAESRAWVSRLAEDLTS